jgi:hypothetical protein
MHCIFMSVAHMCIFALDPVEPKTKIQSEQVQWLFGGPQASSGRDTNLDWIKASPGAFNHAPCLLI